MDIDLGSLRATLVTDGDQAVEVVVDYPDGTQTRHPFPESGEIEMKFGFGLGLAHRRAPGGGGGEPPAVTSTRWRIRITESQGDASKALPEVRMYTSLTSTVNVCIAANGTASASSEYQPQFGFYPPAKAVDGDTGTTWSSASTGATVEAWWEFTYTSQQPIARIEITNTTGGGVAALQSQMPKSMVVERHDGSTWQNAGTFNNQPAWSISGETRVYAVAGNVDTNLPRFFELFMTAFNSASWTEISEMGLRGAIGGASLLTGGKALASLGGTSGRSPSLAFDGNPSTFFECTNSNAAWRLRYEMPIGAGISPVELALRCAAFPGEAPKDGTVRWSRDGYTWTVAGAFANQTGWTAAETRTFALTPP